MLCCYKKNGKPGVIIITIVLYRPEYVDVISAMESAKRKREEVGETDGGKRAERGKDVVGGESKVTEEEVEEFFAILKRIQVAVKYFKKANGGGRMVATGNAWRPRFVLEDFEGDKDDENGGKREDSGLDLNLEPESEEEKTN